MRRGAEGLRGTGRTCPDRIGKAVRSPAPIDREILTGESEVALVRFCRKDSNVSIVGPKAEYDALLLVSFGGPEGPADVLPFLENVTRGRGIPKERLLEVGAHYQHFGGVSPINGQNRELLAALQEALADLELPVFWGNRNWDPYLTDALTQMRDAGVRRALTFITSGYSSYSGCRQYRENLADAVDAVQGAPLLDKVRHWFDHPGFVEPMIDNTVAAWQALGLGPDADVRLVFTTHSVPSAAGDSSGPPAGVFAGQPGGAYVGQHRTVAALVAAGVATAVGRTPSWELVFQSRSGPPQVPWLEPDVSDHLRALQDQGVDGAVMVPIGFASDHMEVVWDLDTEAMATADEIGLACTRAATVGTDPRFVAMVRELVLERVGSAPARALSPLGPWADVCAVGCCPNPRQQRPAVAGSD